MYALQSLCVPQKQHSCPKYVGLARKITEYTVIYGVYIWFWPTLQIRDVCPKHIVLASITAYVPQTHCAYLKYVMRALNTLRIHQKRQVCPKHITCVPQICMCAQTCMCAPTTASMPRTHHVCAPQNCCLPQIRHACPKHAAHISETGMCAPNSHVCPKFACVPLPRHPCP